MSDPASSPESQFALTTVHVRGAIEGRSESLDWIVLHFSPFLRLQARYRLGDFMADRTSVDDVVASAWLATLPRLRELRARDGRYTPVLLRFLAEAVRRIANDTIRDALRRRTRGAAWSESPLEGAVPARIQGALSALEACETAAILGRCLRELEPELQEVLILRGIEGYTNTEHALPSLPAGRDGLARGPAGFTLRRTGRRLRAVGAPHAGRENPPRWMPTPS